MSRIPLRDEAPAIRALSIIVAAMMVALGILVLAGAAALRHIDIEWRNALADRWTVELDASLQASDTDHALAALRAMPGVADVRLVTPDEMRRLLQPWLHNDALAAELPLPVLIDLRIDPQARVTASTLALRISAAIPDAKLDDHGRWTGELLRLVRSGEALGLVLFIAISLTAVSMIVATARARLAGNRAEIELLHTIGASDGYIARRFQADSFRSAIVGALAGTIIAAVVIWLIIHANQPIAPLIPQLRLAPLDWAGLAAVPVGAILLATLVARFTAYLLARRLP